MTDILDKIAPTCAAPDPRNAMTLPPEAYASGELYDLETDRVFKSEWLPLCRVEQLTQPGSYFSIDMLGVPLIVTRDKADVIRVLSRTCRHRWMEVANDAGTANVLQCPYHLWSYALDGRLAGAPEMKESDGFKREDFPLFPYKSEVWQGFVFVNIDGTAEAIDTTLAGLSAYVEPYGLADYKTVSSTDWGVCEWDWKVMVDNFMECYHHMGPHRYSLEGRFPAKLSYTDVGGDGYTVMWSRQAPGFPEEPPFGLPGHPDLDSSLITKSMIFIAYPLLQVVLGPGYMYWLKTMPTGAGRMKLVLDIAMSPTALQGDEITVEARTTELVKNILDVHREDIDACTAVQRAINGGAQGIGRLSILEQPLWEFYRYLGRRFGLPEPQLTKEAM